MDSSASSMIKTEAIQRVLEDNASILNAVIEAQALGRWEDAEKYQRTLHRSMMWLASVADAQQKNDRKNKMVE